MAAAIAVQASRYTGALESFAPKAPSVRHERVLRIQGYSDLTRVRPVIVRAAKEMCMLASRLSEPAVAYRHVAIETIDEQSLVLATGQRFNCPVFQRQLAECERIVPFVLTVGMPLSEKVIELVEAGDLLEGLLLETAGWLCIEDATVQFKTWLREQSLARGERITSRLGPGYSYKIASGMCNWSLEEQVHLFASLGTGALPVTLMSSCAMKPKMSRSGFYGIAPLPVRKPAARAAPRAVVREPN